MRTLSNFSCTATLIAIIALSCKSDNLPERFINSINDRNVELLREMVSDQYFVLLNGDTTTIKSTIHNGFKVDSIHELKYSLISFKKEIYGYELRLIENDIFTKYCLCSSPRETVCELRIEENKIVSAIFYYPNSHDLIASCDERYFQWLDNTYPEIRIMTESIVLEFPFPNSESWVKFNRLSYSKVKEFCSFINEENEK